MEIKKFGRGSLPWLSECAGSLVGIEAQRPLEQKLDRNEAKRPQEQKILTEL